MSTTLIALLICIVAVGLEGIFSGRGVRQRLAALRMPPYSPPFPVWLVIGFAYYGICFIVLRPLLAGGFTFSLGLLIAVLLANGFWGLLFFRWRKLRASFIYFIPYAALVVVLVFSLLRSYPFAAWLFIWYSAYLLYAIWWGYRVWRLNAN